MCVDRPWSSYNEFSKWKLRERTRELFSSLEGPNLSIQKAIRIKFPAASSALNITIPGQSLVFFTKLNFFCLLFETVFFFFFISPPNFQRLPSSKDYSIIHQSWGLTVSNAGPTNASLFQHFLIAITSLVPQRQQITSIQNPTLIFTIHSNVIAMKQQCFYEAFFFSSSFAPSNS